MKRRVVVSLTPWLVSCFLLTLHPLASSQQQGGQMGGKDRPNFDMYKVDDLTSAGDASYSGDLNISIPLLVVPGRHGHDFPISIRYNSNISQRQYASWVGLGWSLDLGNVSRSVVGRADDQNLYLANNGPGNYNLGPDTYNNTNQDHRAEFYGKLSRNHDSFDPYFVTKDQSDVYSVTIDGNPIELIPKLPTPEPLMNLEYFFLPIQYRPWKIKGSSTGGATGTQIQFFEVTTEDGVYYTFGGQAGGKILYETVEGKSTINYIDQKYRYPVKWLLNAIQYPDGSGTFISYNQHNIDPNFVRHASDNASVDRGDPYDNNLFGVGGPGGLNSDRYGLIKHEYSTPDRLDTDTHYALFVSSLPSQDSTECNRRLDAIVLYDKATNTELRRVVFGYATSSNPTAVFNQGGGAPDWVAGQRLNNNQLTLVSIKMQTGSSSPCNDSTRCIPPYTFSYYKNPKVDLEYLATHSNCDFNPGNCDQAFPGYYTDVAFATAWKLRDITLPTGGKITYNYASFLPTVGPEGESVSGLTGLQPRGRLVQKTLWDSFGGSRSWTYDYGTSVYDSPSRPLQASYVPSVTKIGGRTYFPFQLYRNCSVGHRWVRVLNPDGSSRKLSFTSSYQGGDASPSESQPDVFVANGSDRILTRSARRGLVWKEETPLTTQLSKYSFLDVYTYQDRYEYSTAGAWVAQCYVDISSCWSKLDTVVATKEGVTSATSYVYNPAPDSPENGNALVYCTREQSNSATRKTIYSYAYTGYQGMKDNHMLSQLISRSTYEEAGFETDNLARNEATYWSQFNGRWLPSRKVLGSSGTHLIADYLSYDQYSNLTSEADGNRDTTLYYYGSNSDPFNNAAAGLSNAYLTGIKKPQRTPELKVSFKYDHYGNMLQQKDENGDSTRYQYDPLGRLTTVLGPAGQTLARYRYSYSSAAGVPNTIIVEALRKSGDSTVTRHFYDGFGLERQQQVASGVSDVVSHKTYDAMGRPDRVYRTYEMDLGGSLRHTYDPSYHAHAQSYYRYLDADSGTYPYSVTKYDSLGRRTRQYYPGAYFTDIDPQNSHCTRFSYGANGTGVPTYPQPGSLYKQTINDENSHQTATYTDKLGNVVASVADSAVLNLVTLTQYDVLARVTRTMPPDQISKYVPKVDSITMVYPQSTGLITLSGLPITHRKLSNVTLSARTSQGYALSAAPMPLGPTQSVIYYYVRQYRNGQQVAVSTSQYLSDLENNGLSARSADYLVEKDIDEIRLDIYSTSYATSGLTLSVVFTSTPQVGSAFFYNDFDQLVWKASPDADTVRYRYDAAGNLRFEQDGKMKAAGKFLYRKYDRLTRLVEAGEYTGSFFSVDSTTTGNPANDFPQTGGVMRVKRVYDTNISGDASARKLLGRLSCALSDNNSVRDSVFYSYNDFGRVEWQISKISGLTSRMKLLYEYDWQGNATKMSCLDLGKSSNNTYFFYEYDVLGRLAREYSGINANGSYKIKDAEYTYLGSGKVRRLTLGNAQGVDYKYNVRDWLAQINHQNLNTSQDPGHDGPGGSGVPYLDRFGMVIGYHNQEHVGSAQAAPRQYNGNVSWVMYNMSGLSYTGPGGTASVVGYSYNYDNTNRIKGADFGYYTTAWLTTKAYDDSVLSYDRNGNFLTLQRYGRNAALMDNLTYQYTPNTNRLWYIDDTVPAGTFSVDIDDQSPNNYIYDANGNMIKDVQGSIDTVIYDWRNLPLQIKKAGVTTTYRYDADGRRTFKSKAGGETNYYVNDVQGRTLVIMRNNGSFLVNLYGMDNVGQINVTYGPAPQKAKGALLLPDVRNDARYYYLKDHLGTIRVTVSEYGDVSSYDDYYPFGMQMEGRSGNLSQGDARYKFTGKERDAETGYDYFGARYYDARIGRFLSVDPKAFRFAFVSPYHYALNNPLKYIDPNGESSLKFDRKANLLILFSSSNKELGRWKASNKPISSSKGVFADGGQLETGTYDFMDEAAPYKHGEAADEKGIKKDSKNGAFGEYGIFRLEDFTDSKGIEHRGVGVHSGRADRRGYETETEGCIRTEDEAMERTVETAKDDPLESLEVVDPPVIDSPINLHRDSDRDDDNPNPVA